MPIRPLLLVAALAGGDYLLWTWSSDGDSTTVALVSGLALAPLILALLWLLSVGVARAVIARAANRPASRSAALAPARRRGRAHGAAREEEQSMPARASGRQPQSEKIAA